MDPSKLGREVLVKMLQDDELMTAVVVESQLPRFILSLSIEFSLSTIIAF